MSIQISFDGSCTINPGGIGYYGFTIHKNGALLKAGNGEIGSNPEMSNNVAEYYGVLKALEHLDSVGEYSKITIMGDSQLIVNQLNGKWRVKSKNLKTLYNKVVKLLKKRSYEISWIPREQNKEADLMSKLR